MAFVDNGKDAAGRQNIDFTFARGDTRGIQFTLDDGATPTPAPIDLTGASLKLAVNSDEEPDDTTNQVFELTGNITDAPNGVVQFRPSLVQANQTPETYFYDVQLTLASGDVVSVAAGKWVYLFDISDAGV